MQHIVTYDLADDKRRHRASELLLGYGRRLEESVFFIDVDEPLLSEMIGRLERILVPEEDCVHIFALCSACQEKIRVLGRGRIPKDEDFYVF
ncbi:MAG: CRISPR-associated endonuclease Cas2 [Bryobacterales bacterium]|nr:CRISPR-associated endonuclease Cas2 [Bryobacterales bacterium]